jgi:hypothetical protein
VFKAQIPYLTRVNTASKEPGSSLGPFADSQMAGKEFLNTWLAKLRDTNILPAKKYGPFDESIDLKQRGNQIIPNTGKDPFLHSGSEYLMGFLNNYDNSQVLDPEERVSPQGLTSYVQQRAEKGKEFPGSEGTAVS